MAVDSVIANGTIISGAKVKHSVIFNNVFLHSCGDIDGCILFSGCNIGRNVQMRNVICDKYVTVEDNACIGCDLEQDARRFTITPGGIVIIPKGSIVPAEGPILHKTMLPPPGSIRPQHHAPGSVTTPDTEHQP